MYSHYYINHNEQTNGDYEVHKESCSWLPSIDNRTYLGYFSSSIDAVLSARQKFPGWKVNGCYFCSPESHTS